MVFFTRPIGYSAPGGWAHARGVPEGTSGDRLVNVQLCRP